MTPILSAIKESLSDALQSRDKQGMRWYVEDALEQLEAAIQQTQAHETKKNPVTLDQILASHKPLAAVYQRLCTLDANGACCAANDIEDTVNLWGGCLDALATELNATCDRIQQKGQE